MGTIYFFTLRGKHSGRLYYGTGATFFQACKEIGISHKSLILERKESLPAQLSQEAELERANQSTSD